LIINQLRLFHLLIFPTFSPQVKKRIGNSGSI